MNRIFKNLCIIMFALAMMLTTSCDLNALKGNVSGAFGDSMPDVVNMDAREAIDYLMENGFADEDITVQNAGTTLINDDVYADQYKITEQSIEVDDEITEGDDVVLVAQTYAYLRCQELRTLKYLRVESATEKAMKMGCDYLLYDADGNIFDTEYEELSTEDQNNLFVIEVRVAEESSRTPEFVVADFDKASELYANDIQTLRDKVAIDANAYAESLGLNINYMNGAGKSITIDNSNGEDYKTVDIASYALDDKTVYLELEEYMSPERQALLSQIPASGLNAKYIDQTGAGEHTSDSVEGKGQSRITTYIWKSNDGNDVLIAKVQFKKVISVEKCNTEVYWTGALPDYTASMSEYKARIEKEAEEERQRQAEAAAAQERASITVYLTNSGNCYHYDGCRYLKSKAVQLTLGEAQRRGIPGCSYCYTNW